MHAETHTELVDPAYRMPLRSAERRDHLCTDLVYRRWCGKPFDFKRFAVLLLFFKGVAEREGFEPPIGLHLCRISSAVHSTTLPPLRVPRRIVIRRSVGASSRRGWRGRQARRGQEIAFAGLEPPHPAGWGRQTREKLAAPCRVIEIVGRKCGFVASLSDAANGSDCVTACNANPILT